MRISTKKILITILIAALSLILIFAASCSSTENPEEKIGMVFLRQVESIWRKIIL